MASAHPPSEFQSFNVFLEWDTLMQGITPGAPEIELDGNSLDIATVVALAR
jgi:hypothetical protein